MTTDPIRVDLGCGNAKRPGYIGLDYVDGPQVDHVLDLTRDVYPFADSSVDEVFSAHFLEHIDEPNHVFSEIGRICRDGARIEIWTPYAFSNEAFLYGHLHYLTEEPWMHFCVHHADAYAPMLGGRWLLHGINFVVPPPTVAELRGYDVRIDFAIRYLKGVVYEFGVDIEYQSDLSTPVVAPRLTWSATRDGERWELPAPHPLFGAPLVTDPPAGAPRAPAPPASRLQAILRNRASRLPESVKPALRRFGSLAGSGRP